MLRLLIHTPPGFCFRTTLLSHGWLELSPFSHSKNYATLYRIEQLSDGTVVRLSIAPSHDDALDVQADDADLTDEQERELRKAVERIFNLELDLGSFYERLEGLSRYDWVEAHGGGRLLRSPSVWEDLAKTLLTTNTTWSMTRQMVSRLTTLGDVHSSGSHAFPTPERIASMTCEEMGDHVRAGYRNAYLHELATCIAEGRVDVESWADERIPAGELNRHIRSLQGFGPYAAGAVLKLLGRFDELALDSAARSMFAREFGNDGKVPDSLIRQHYEPYGEWRGLVIWMDLMRDWFTDQLRLS